MEANAAQAIPTDAQATSATGTAAGTGTAGGMPAGVYERTRSGRLKKKREAAAPRTASVADVQAEALRLELDQIQEMRDAGRISRSLAREMRADVYLQQMGLDD